MDVHFKSNEYKKDKVMKALFLSFFIAKIRTFTYPMGVCYTQ